MSFTQSVHVIKDSTVYMYTELEQISREYRQRCGGEGETMNEEQFTKLLTSLGYPPERCSLCFRYTMPEILFSISKSGHPYNFENWELLLRT